MKISRYFTVLILLAAFSLLFVTASRAENKAPDEFCVASDYKFTPAELRSLELVKKAKELEKKLGYKETENFKSFDKDVEHTIVMYQLKTELPFSHEDCRFFEIKKKHSKGSASEIAWLARHLKVTEDNYDIDVYCAEVVSGGTPISPAMLRANPSRLAYLVFHEDWHDNVDLPTHFEEASGNLIGFVAAAIFLGSNNKDIHKELEEYSKYARAINRCHDEISQLVTQLKNKKISRNRYLSKRRQCIIVAEKSQSRHPHLDPINVANGHTYTYYWPLVNRLYRALDCDLVRFILVLKEVNEHEEMREPSWLELSREDYFIKSREVERRIEAYLENIIRGVLAQ